MSPVVREVRDGDVAFLASRLRTYDIETLRDYAPHLDPAHTLQCVVNTATASRSIEDETGVVAILGINTDPSDETLGQPWLAASDGIYAHRTWLPRNIRRLIQEMTGTRYRLHVGEFNAANRNHPPLDQVVRI